MEDNMATNRIITNTENDRHACPLTVSLSLFTTVDVPFKKQKFNDTVITIQSFFVACDIWGSPKDHGWNTADTA